MEPTLAIIGLNYRTSPVAVREQFWIAEPARYEALHRLLRSEGIEEVVVLATCNRTEFILWSNDVPAAANSVLRFLTHDYQLKLCDWSHFYRLMDDVALTHLFQVAAGLDSVVLGEPEITAQLREAWEQARKAGATGRFLDAAIQKALAVSARVRTDTALGDATITFPYAAVELAMGVLGRPVGPRSIVSRCRADERVGSQAPEQRRCQPAEDHEPHAAEGAGICLQTGGRGRVLR